MKSRAVFMVAQALFEGFVGSTGCSNPVFIA